MYNQPELEMIAKSFSLFSFSKNRLRSYFIFLNRFSSSQLPVYSIIPNPKSTALQLIAIYFLLFNQASFKIEFKAFMSLVIPDFNIRYL